MFKKSLLIMMLLALFAPWAAGQTRSIVYNPVVASQDDWSGNYLMVNTSASKAAVESISFNMLNTTGVTISDGSISSVGDAAIVTITKQGNVYSIKIGNKYLKRYSASSTNLQLVDSYDNSNLYNWTISYSSGIIVKSASTNQSAYIYYNSGYSQFGLQNSSSTIELYKETEIDDTYPKPTGLEVTALGSNSATISWTAPNAPEGYTLSSYECQFQANGASSWTSATPEGTSCSLSGLTSATQYTFQVRAIYTNGTETHESLWASTDFTTACGTISVGYSCNFEGPNASGTSTYPLPTCWARESGNNPYVYDGSSYAHGGTKALRFYGTGSSTQTAILPELDEDLNGIRLSFWAKTVSNTYTMSIGYLNSSDVFVQVGDNISVTDTYTQYYVDFGEYEGDPRHIVIRRNAIGTDYNGVYVDDVTIGLTPTCLPPTLAFNENSITTNSVELSCTGGTTNEWQVEVKANNGEWMMREGTITTSPFTLGSLNPSTNYQVRVRTYCNADDQSDWSNIVSFTTACATITTYPWSENFDSYTISSSSSPSTHQLPNCWNYINTSTSSTNNIYPTMHYYSYNTYANSTPNYIRFYSSAYYSTYDPQDQYAILPEMQNVSGLRIKLWARANSTSSSYDATFKVGVMTDPADASTFTEIATKTPTSTTYTEYVIPLDS